MNDEEDYPHPNNLTTPNSYSKEYKADFSNTTIESDDKNNYDMKK